MGQIANERGALSEDKVLEALRTNPPDWLVSARKGDKEEDRKGRDLVVQTRDHGDLYVQVKSSRAGARSFETQEGRLCVLVVRPGETIDSLRTRAHRALEKLMRRLSH